MAPRAGGRGRPRPIMTTRRPAGSRPQAITRDWNRAGTTLKRPGRGAGGNSGAGGGFRQDLVAERGPLERVPDALGDVVLRPPAEQPLGAAGPGVGAGHVTGPAGGLTALHRAVGYLVERRQQLPDRGTRAAAQVDDAHRSWQVVEPGERGHVR